MTAIHDLAAELCDPHQHTERVWDWVGRNRKLTRAHSIVLPGLLTQLRDAVHPAMTADTGRPAPASRPPLLLEALSAIVEIGMGVNEWTWRLRLAHRGDLEANIRQLASASLDADTSTALYFDLRRWRSWAAVLTGWDLPPLTPWVECPVDGCGRLGTLRVIPDRRTGYCRACQTVWDDTDGSIGVLAEYIAGETRKDRPTAPLGSTMAGHGGWAERKAAEADVNAIRFPDWVRS